MSDYDKETEDYEIPEECYCESYDDFCTCTVCAQCGYRFIKDDDIVRVMLTGDVIHRDCFTEYCDENIESLAKSVRL